MRKITWLLILLLTCVLINPVSAEVNHFQKVRKQIREKFTAYEHTLTWPAQGTVSQYYGDALINGKVYGFKHGGIDIAIEQSTPVKAAMSGTVIRVHKGNNGTYGFVMVANKKGVATIYGEISEILVAKNQKVKEGDVIALSGGEPGTDGAGYLSTGPHLHFEVRLMGLQFNPERYLE